MLCFDQFTDCERFPDSEWLLYPENYLQKIILQNMISRDLQDNFYHPTRNLDVTFLYFFIIFERLISLWKW